MNLLSSILSPNIDYQNLMLVIGLWLLALWLMFCLWVFVDAQKRYKKFYVALLMALIILVFNFPALIFYLIIRPEENWQDLGLFELDHQHGGVDVPVVNFIGEDGQVQVSLNLTVSPRLSEHSDMTVDIGWDSNQANMQLVERKAKPEITEMNLAEAPNNVLTNRLQSLRNKASMSLHSMRSSMDSSLKKADAYSQELNQQDDVESLSAKQKKGKKK